MSEGLVLATVDSDLIGENEVQDVTNAARGVALSYATELWGYSSREVIVLVPRGEQLAADFSIMNGQFQFSGLLRRSEEPTVPSEPTFRSQMLCKARDDLD